MAGNKKIFDLPLRTGVTADDRLAIVDSGNTTTYSVKLSDLQDGTGVNTLESLTGNITLSGGTDITITDNGSDTITISSSATNVSSLESLTGDITFSGTNIDITTSGQTIYLSGSTGGGGSSFFEADTTEPSNILQSSRGHSITYGTGAIEDNFFLGGSGNTINASIGTAQPYYRNVLLGGLNNTIFPDFSNASWSSNNTAIIAGNTNRIGRESDNSVIMGGRTNSIGYGEDNAIIGGNNNILTGGGSVLIGGDSNEVAGADSCNVGGLSHKSRGQRTGTFAGNNNTVEINCVNSVALGGINNSMNACGYDNSAFVGGNGNTISGDNSLILGGSSNTISNNLSVIAGGNNNNISGKHGFIGGGQNHIITVDEGAIIGGLANDVRGRWSVVAGCDNSNVYGTFSLIGAGAAHNCNGNQSAIIGGQSNTNNHDYSVVLGGSGLTTNYAEEVLVPNLTIANYGSLNYADDTAAAAGGVVLGQVYHNNGQLRIRIV